MYIVQPTSSTRTIGISKQQKCTRHKAHSRFDNNEVSFSVFFVLSCNRQKPNSHAQYALFVRLQIECLFFHFVLQYRIYSFHDYSLLSSMYNRTQTKSAFICVSSLKCCSILLYTGSANAFILYEIHSFWKFSSTGLS